LSQKILHPRISIGADTASKGDHKCVIELSPDPVTPTSWVRLEGNGLRRALSGYAEGMWWIRAATSVATEQSDWFGPVAIVVK
jgi:hypothetical protein